MLKLENVKFFFFYHRVRKIDKKYKKDNTILDKDTTRFEPAKLLNNGFI